MNRETQNGQILEYLRSGRALTPIEALDYFGCFRLSGRIHELRQHGYRIESDLINRSGKKVAQYRLVQ